MTTNFVAWVSLLVLNNVIANPENNLLTWVTRWQSTFGWFSASSKFFWPFSCSLPFTGNKTQQKGQNNSLYCVSILFRLRRRNDPQQQGKSDNKDSEAAEYGQQTPPPTDGLMNFTQRFGFFAFASSFLLFFCAYWYYLLYLKRYLFFETDSYFNNVGKDNFTEPYQCYNNRSIDNDTHYEYTKCGKS